MLLHLIRSVEVINSEFNVWKVNTLLIDVLHPEGNFLSLRMVILL